MAERTKLGMSLAEFMEKFDEQPFEMIAGEIFVILPKTKGQGKVSKRIYEALLHFDAYGEIYFHACYILGDGHWVADSRVPDVSFYEQSRFEDYEANYPNQEEKPFVLVPDLVVEVISPTDKFSDISKKIEAYRSDGVKLLWIVDPQNQTITVYEAGKESPLKLKRGDILKGSEVLKGFEMSVSEVLGK